MQNLAELKVDGTLPVQNVTLSGFEEESLLEACLQPCVERDVCRSVLATAARLRLRLAMAESAPPDAAVWLRSLNATNATGRPADLEEISLPPSVDPAELAQALNDLNNAKDLPESMAWVKELITKGEYMVVDEVPAAESVLHELALGPLWGRHYSPEIAAIALQYLERIYTAQGHERG